jgi:hypothetical protein
MDVPSVATLRMASPNMDFDQRRSTSRSHSPTSTESIQSHTPMAMAIPNMRCEEAPPPLPPPRYNDDLARGIDLAWNWGNGHELGGSCKLAPVKPGSSLFGGYMGSRAGRDNEADDDFQGMEIDRDFDRRGSTVSTIRSPSQAEIHTVRTIQNGIRRPSSPAANQRSVTTSFFSPALWHSLSRSGTARESIY